MENLDITVINNFWLFFEQISPDIVKNFQDPKLIASIDEEINKLGDVTWEYGPWNNGFYFCLSPNFRFDLIPFTDYAISSAPKLIGWKFISGKPQKLDAVDQFNFIENDGSRKIINTKNWRAIAYKFEDGTYDVDFIMDSNYDEDTNYLALNLAMVNLLGEINYIRKVENIKIIKKFDSDVNQKGIKFIDLVNVII